jgi:nucleoside-diphosphate-sugar epimerase
MRVFVTGATGLVGRGAVSALKAAGHEPLGLTSQDSKRFMVERLGATAVVGDMREGTSWIEQARSADAIIHCAKPGAKRLGRKQVQEWADADLKCLDQLLAAARDGNKPLVYTSGAWVYGAGKDRRVEDSPLNPFPHIAHKVRAEEMVLAAARSNDVKGIVLRPGMVYAPWGQFAEQYLRTMVGGGSARYAGNGSNLQSWVHIEDLARAFVLAIEKAPGGRIFNVADDEPVSINSLLGALAEAFGAKQPRGAPAFMIRLLLGRSFASALMSDAVCSNVAMKSELGLHLEYPTYREGVKRIAEVHADPDSRAPAQSANSTTTGRVRR